VSELIDLRSLRAVHVVGAGGAGMSAIATILSSMGKKVTGSDLKDSAALQRLAALGIEVHVGHAADVLGPVDAVAVSTAVPATNPEVVAAGERGIPVLRRADILAAICGTRRTVAVGGTHGKTTTSSMLSLILVEAGMNPSFLVGGDLNEVGGGAVWDNEHPEAPFVVEADESDGTFVELGAEAVIVTNLEADHLEHWGTFDALVGGFERFVSSATGPKLVGADDPGSAALARLGGCVTFGMSEAADWRLVHPAQSRSGTRFGVVHGGEEVGSIALAAPGLHNARNALAALAMAAELGAPVAAAERALARYAGVARRWQFRGEVNGITFIDDYAHLASEVAAAVATAQAGGWRRVTVVFQPHRFSRIAKLWSTFADAFVGADTVVITEIDAYLEAPRPGVTGKLIVDAVLEAHPQAHVAWLPGRRDIMTYLERSLRPGDLCLTLGAGDITSLPDEMLEALEARSE
jgi:UDP-N-acetylmuramate--alanine ligase